MPEYAINLNATSNTSANTEDEFVEIPQPYSKIKRIEVRQGNGTEAGGVDNNFRVRLLVLSVLSAGAPVAATEEKLDQNSRASGLAVVVKNGTTALALGTVAAVLHQAVRNARETYVYDREVKMNTDLVDGGGFAIAIQSPVVSTLFQVYVIYED